MVAVAIPAAITIMRQPTPSTITVHTVLLPRLAVLAPAAVATAAIPAEIAVADAMVKYPDIIKGGVTLVAPFAYADIKLPKIMICVKP